MEPMNLLHIEGALAMIHGIYNLFFELCDIALVGEKWNSHGIVACVECWDAFFVRRVTVVELDPDGKVLCHVSVNVGDVSLTSGQVYEITKELCIAVGALLHQ